MRYEPDYHGLDDILRGGLMRAEMHLEAQKGVPLAQGIAPKKTGAFAASIHVEDGGEVEVTDEYGTTTMRATAQIVADDEKGVTIEAGAKKRYHSGQNRAGHHTLAETAKLMNGG